MKTAWIILFALAFVALFGGIASASDATQMFDVLLLPPQDYAGAVSVTGTATDVSTYKGNALFVFQFEQGAAASRTNTITIQHSTTGSSAWVTLTNLAGTACVGTETGTNTTAGTIEHVGCDLARARKYIRAIGVGHAASTNGMAAVMIAPMKSQ